MQAQVGQKELQSIEQLVRTKIESYYELIDENAQAFIAAGNSIEDNPNAMKDLLASMKERFSLFPDNHKATEKFYTSTGIEYRLDPKAKHQVSRVVVDETDVFVFGHYYDEESYSCRFMDIWEFKKDEELSVKLCEINTVVSSGESKEKFDKKRSIEAQRRLKSDMQDAMRDLKNLDASSDKLIELSLKARDKVGPAPSGFWHYYGKNFKSKFSGGGVGSALRINDHRHYEFEIICGGDINKTPSQYSEYLNSLGRVFANKILSSIPSRILGLASRPHSINLKTDTNRKPLGRFVDSDTCESVYGIDGGVDISIRNEIGSFVPSHHFLIHLVRATGAALRTIINSPAFEFERLEFRIEDSYHYPHFGEKKLVDVRLQVAFRDEAAE